MGKTQVLFLPLSTPPPGYNLMSKNWDEVMEWQDAACGVRRWFRTRMQVLAVSTASQFEADRSRRSWSLPGNRDLIWYDACAHKLTSFSTLQNSHHSWLPALVVVVSWVCTVDWCTVFYWGIDQKLCEYVAVDPFSIFRVFKFCTHGELTIPWTNFLVGRCSFSLDQILEFAGWWILSLYHYLKQ
jgi:hypothetical protein